MNSTTGLRNCSYTQLEQSSINVCETKTTIPEVSEKPYEMNAITPKAEDNKTMGKQLKEVQLKEVREMNPIVKTVGEQLQEKIEKAVANFCQD